MLQSSELRIGNYITDATQQFLKVSSIDKGSCNVEGRVSYHFEDSVTGIFLTPEILKQLGFKKQWEGNNQSNYYLNNIEIVYSLNTNPHFLYKRSLNTYTNFEFLHQLQNLYHALTGEELQVNISQLLTN